MRSTRKIALRLAFALFGLALRLTVTVLLLAGLRCLGVAYRRGPAGWSAVTRSDERELVFAGILCLSDSLKSNAAEALARLDALGSG